MYAQVHPFLPLQFWVAVISNKGRGGVVNFGDWKWRWYSVIGYLVLVLFGAVDVDLNYPSKNSILVCVSEY